VHRDLKPANVMVVDDGRVKVLDFGIAYTSKFSRITRPGTFVGTLDYASPEQLRLENATPQSDLYAVGLMLYEMLTGSRALDFTLRTTEDHPAPSSVVPDMPPPIERITMKLLARETAERYESASLLIRDLRPFIGPHSAD